MNMMFEYVSKLTYMINSVKMVTVRSRTLIITLLLISGDVEMNPGPMTEEELEKVDNSQTLTEDDFYEVYEEVVSIAAEYYTLGIGLRLKVGELQTIFNSFGQNVRRAFTDVLLAWLRQQYDTAKYGPPTWRMLVRAVDGNNHALAMTISRNHTTEVGTTTRSVNHHSNHPLPQQLVQQPLHPVMAAPPSGPGSSSAAGSYMFHPPSSYLGFPSQPGHHYNYVTHQAQPQPFFDPMPQPQYVYSYPPQRQCSQPNVNSSMYWQQDRGTDPPPAKRHKLATLPKGLLDRWRKLLADRYLVEESSSDTWPPLKIVQFIDLALVRQSKEADHLGLKTVSGNIDEIYGDKIKIAVENILANLESGSLILFEGRPGSGKTTQMIKISRDWADNKLFQSKLVFLIQLRRLNGKEDIYLSDLFRVACEGLLPEDIRGLTSYTEESFGEGVVLVLDGFDEYAPGSNEDSFIFKLVAKKLFSRAIIIVASRPAATQRFRSIATKWIEVVGFKKDDIFLYIQTYFKGNQEKVETLTEHLEHHPNLINLCYLPLHCAMLVFIHEKGISLPKTETEFYHDFVISSLVRCTCKKSNKYPFNLSKFKDLPCDEKIVFDKICQLAFEATVTSKQIFKQSELCNIRFDDANEDVNSLGLLVIDRYFVKFGLDETYSFLHLSLQEYLSAVYIAGLSATKQEAIINEYGNKPHLFVTWRFLFGTLDYSKDTTTNLFKLLMEATHEVNNSCNLSIQCTFESQNDLACSHVIVFYKNKLTFSELSLTSTDIASIVHLIKCSKCTYIHLSFKECMLSEDNATALLQGIGDCQLSLTLQGDFEQLIHCVPILNALNVVSAVSAPNLVQLEVIGCCQSNLKEILEFPNLKNIATLQALKFEYVTEIAGLEECFQHWPKLKELYLCDYCYDVTHAQAIIKELKFCRQLQRLTFCGVEFECCLDESACRVIGETLQYLPKLHHIDLTYNVNIDDSAVAHLAKGLTHCVHLEELNLGLCLDINDSEATHLAEGLAHCPHLKELNLLLCTIGDTGVKVLLESLMMNCKGIRELNLDDNILTNKSIPCLMEFIESSKNLEKLVLLEDNDECMKFTERGWSKLVEAVEQRNSTEGMTQLKLVGKATMESEEESSQSEEESDESEEASGK